jgi:hypothetical protein
MFSLHLDMQFGDLRALLRLPTKSLPNGCNFVAASCLFNLLSGFSVCLFDASESSLTATTGSGKRLKRLLLAHFPWPPGMQPATSVDIFYTWARNPLTHALGLDGRTGAPLIRVAKDRLTPGRILKLENDAVMPEWATPSLVEEEPDGEQQRYALHVDGLYWGTHRLLHSLLDDASQRAKAESLVRSLGY